MYNICIYIFTILDIFFQVSGNIFPVIFSKKIFYFMISDFFPEFSLGSFFFLENLYSDYHKSETPLIDHLLFTIS